MRERETDREEGRVKSERERDRQGGGKRRERQTDIQTWRETDMEE